MSVGYSATRDRDGTLTIRRVPIFVECERGEFKADASWIEAAVARAKDAEREGYMPPLHIRHHGEASDVRAAGYFRITGAEHITFQGERRLAVMADLVITDPSVQVDVLAKRLPYRSVEIFNVGKPSIDSLALLDHEAPYLALPMLMVGDLDDRSSPSSSIVYANMRQPWPAQNSPQDASLVACFRHGAGAHLLFQDGTMTTKTNEEGDRKKVVKMADAPAPQPEPEASPAPKEGGEEDTGGEDGKVSKAAMVKVLKALLAMFTDDEPAAPPVAEEPPVNMSPVAANVPGQAMRKQEVNPMNLEMAKVSGELEAVKAQLAARDKAEKRREDVAIAMQRLEGRPMGSIDELKARLVKFHEQHGSEAFAAHIDSIVTTFAAYSGDVRTIPEQPNRQTPDVALAYQAQGIDAVNRAAAFAAEHDALVARNMSRVSREDYVRINMARIAAQS